jgi:hypothetical protein
VISGSYAYLADDATGLQIIDITDPSNPSLVGEYDTPGVAWDVTISGNYVYIADDTTGVVIVNISDPSHPSLVGSCDTPGDARGIFLLGEYAYIADVSGGLQAVDVSDPSHSTPAGSYDTPGDSFGIFAHQNYAYMAEHYSLMVLELQQPLDAAEEDPLPVLHSSLHQNYPNPFNPVTTIEFNMPRRDHVTVEVFDLLGRRVLTLINGVLPAGTHRVEWNGLDEEGRSVASGVYLYRLRATEWVETKKMLLLK